VKFLYWDIDGTLIRTDKAGLYAFEQATLEILGAAIEYNKITTAGMTDRYIAEQVIETALGRPALESEVAALTKRYEELLPEYLAARNGHILPFVKEILDTIDRRDDYVSFLLTGNSRTGAQIKLSYFGLAHYFDFAKSAFCEQYCDRIAIARYALAAIDSAYPGTLPEQMYIIGDTPNDIRCGKAIGARTIAIATGTYSLEQLQAYSPWMAVGQLPAAEEFVQILAAGV